MKCWNDINLTFDTILFDKKKCGGRFEASFPFKIIYADYKITSQLNLFETIPINDSI